MAELHRKFLTRSISTITVILFGLIGILLGWAIFSVNGIAGVLTVAISVIIVVSAWISWRRGFVSELHIEDSRIVMKYGELISDIARADVSQISCNDQSDIERLSIVLRNGKEIHVPEPCFRRVRPIVTFFRNNWPDIPVVLNGKHL